MKIEIINTVSRTQFTLHPKPLIAFSGTHMYFNIAAIEKLKLKKGAEILLGGARDNLYIAEVTMKDYIKGSQLSHAKNLKNIRSKLLMCCSNGIQAKKLKGQYMVSKEIAHDESRELDWIKITKM